MDAELFHANGRSDGQTDMTETKSRFSKFLRTRIQIVK